MDIDITKNNYLKDILFQPKAIEDTYHFLQDNGRSMFSIKEIHSGNYRQVILTGMGASYFALFPIYYRLMAANISVVLMETSELLYYADALFSPENLFVVVSQSGNSAEIIHLFELLTNNIDVVGITNIESSVLGQKSTWVIPLQAGEEFSVSCKTYLASLVSLLWLGDHLLPQTSGIFKDALEIIPGMQQYVDNFQNHINTFRSDFAGIKDLIIIGRGDSLANVYTGGLILKESAHFHAEGMSTAAFRHGPKEMLSSSVLTMMLEGAQKTRALNHQMVDEIRKMGFPAILLSEVADKEAYRLPKVNHIYRHLVEILPIQMASIAIALNDGHQAGVFSIGSKITDVE